jgi:cytochrome c peroxidase
VLYWDGRAANLEAQGIGALKAGNMGLGDQLEAKMQEIGALPEYKAAFAEVFGLDAADPVTSEHVTKALSAYERTLLCGDTAFDRQALDEAAERGQILFMGKASCVTCHNGPAFSDGLPHVTGVAVDPTNADADTGMAAITNNDADKFKFRSPTLRNISKTAPYFHNGSVAKLDDAVRIMASGGVRHPGLPPDPLLLDRKLTEDEIGDLVAFLRGLDCPGELEVIGDQATEGIAAPGEVAKDPA